MLELADRPIEEIKVFLAARGLEAGYLVPTETGLEKALMDAHGQLRDYLRREGVHDYAAQEKGGGAKVRIPAWYVGADSLEEASASMYRPETKNGDPRIWLSGLPKHSIAGNVLALLAHAGEIYIANVSRPDIWESASNPSTPLGQLLDKMSAAKNRPIADRFSAWNLRLLQSFFSEASKGEEVFLRVDKDALDEIGQDLGGDAGFIEAVRGGPSWRRPNSSLVDRVGSLVRQRNLIQRLKPSDYEDPRKLAIMLELAGYIDPGHLDQNYRGHAAPAYLPYLAMFVRIATTSAQDGFYSHLRETLGLQEQFGPVQMAPMRNVWADLEQWTSRHAGRFGRFKLRNLGGYVHLSVPQSQSILKAGDIQRIPFVFKRAEIRPDRDLSDALVNRILNEAKVEAKRPGTFFSRSFCAALDKSEFDAPVNSILRAIYEDWDGTLPDKNQSDGTQQDDGSKRHGLGLCLSVAQEDPLELEVHWNLPAIHDSGNFELRHGDFSWVGTYAGADGGVTRAVKGLDQHAWRIAEASFNGDVQFDLTSRLGDETEEVREQVALEKHLLWLLVPEMGGPDGRAWLREGDLPGHGTAFLLAPTGNIGRLKRYLEMEKPDHDIVEADGLPSGWMLVRLNECSSLTDNQRTLPDGAEAHPVPRLIRFAGGRSVRRGYGHMYLPYDLPTVELDAPAGAVLSWPEGLEATEDGVVEGNPSTLFRPIRRFKLRLLSSGSAAYKFDVLLDGEAIGRPATLRISGADGDLVEIGQHFSLDSLGRPQPSMEGLSGVLPECSALDPLEDGAAIVLPVEARNLGEADGCAVGMGVEEKFLDALAQPGVGAMDAGVARKLIGRYLADAGRSDNPTFLLMELRSRGHIEISTTQKGHMSRVHVVQPTIFQLPVQAGGRKVYGVLGTLRLAHWEALALGESTWRAYRGRTGNLRSDVMRLVEEAQGAIEHACSVNGSLGLRGFRYANFPSLAIAQWSEGMDVVREAALRNPMESIGRAADGAMRFNAVMGKFSARPSTLPLELWKTTDLDTGLGSVHYLVKRENTNLLHAFVRDSRWGVWIILEAFVRNVREQFGREDVHPFPLTYDAVEGVVWLPARIGLPVALERALVLCSGALPGEFELVPDDGALVEERLTMRLKAGGMPKVRVSPVYEGMASGKWLAYQWVPEAVAATVANRLGARLDVV